MIENSIKKVLAIQVLASISIWVTLVCCIWEIGYCKGISAVSLGIMSFCFSGSMALFNGIMSVLMKPIHVRKYWIVAMIIDVVAFGILKQDELSIVKAFMCIFVISACFSVIGTAVDKYLETTSLEGVAISEKIFKLLRFSGPILGGLLVYWYPFKTLMLFNMVICALIVLILLFVRVPKNNEPLEKVETKYIDSKFYDANENIVKVLIAMTFVVTICIQMVDAQLATLFRMVDIKNGSLIGICIGISGTGVFLISLFMEKYLVKEYLFYIGMVSMGFLLCLAGIVFSILNMTPIICIFTVFLFGGIFWQIIMSTLENVIKSFTSENTMMKYFSVVGSMIIVSYSVGALGSGFVVRQFGILKMYIGIGGVLVVIGTIGRIVNFKSKKESTDGYTFICGE